MSSFNMISYVMDSSTTLFFVQCMLATYQSTKSSAIYYETFMKKDYEWNLTIKIDR